MSQGGNLTYIEYKGYAGGINYHQDDKLFHGRIAGINDIVSFQGATIEELKKDFHEAVENYMKACVKIEKGTKKDV
jgi:predicted HicB family RNase H-like nuclease